MMPLLARLRGVLGALLLVPLLLTACAAGPAPVHVNEEECAHCRMLISERRYAAQLLTVRGKPYKFDSIECLVAFVRDGAVAAADVKRTWVTDFAGGAAWIDVVDATFLRSSALRTPMGGGLAAFAAAADASAERDRVGGELLRWPDLLAAETPAHEGHDHGHGVSRAIEVGSDGTVGTLAAALAAAQPGDTLRVRAGTYREGPLHVTVPVAIIGEPGAVIENAGGAGLLRVTADDVTIRGLTLRGTPASHVRDNAALELDGVSSCTIADNRFEDNFFALHLAQTTGCRVTGNVIVARSRRESSAGNGIHLWSSTDAVIERNEVRGHRDGIYLEHVRGATLQDNVSEDNLRYGLHFMFSSGNRYIGNTFRRNGAGVAVMYSQDVLVQGNRFEDNWGAAAYGLLLKEISDSRIEDNEFRRNTVAVSSEGSTRVTVAGNRFVRNGWAARVLANSQQNTFSGNSFIENTFDVTTNSRQNPNTFDGNYWSRYRGYDLSGDGVGDVPHRPVRLFALLVQRTPGALVLLRSAFLDLLEVAERVAPVLTPETLVDNRPLMREAR